MFIVAKWIFFKDYVFEKPCCVWFKFEKHIIKKVLDYVHFNAWTLQKRSSQIKVKV